MKKQIDYPKIHQFRNIVSSIRKGCEFVGVDENGEATFNHNLSKPIINFTGTVKLHGTNAAVCMNEKEFWVQSRTRIITPESDNAGFAFFAHTHRETFEHMAHYLSLRHNIDLSKNTISVYGEWAGKGIQKSVAISELARAFYIFGAKVSPFEEESSIGGESAFWLDISEDKLSSPTSRIFSIYSFKHYSIDIDFNYPELAQEQLIKITEQVEEECPVAKQMGVSGIGEGVVWSTKPFGDFGYVHRFKVKGEKHSSSKVKTLASVDVDKVKSIREFVDYAMTENRLEQSIKEVFGDEERSVKRLGDLIRWNINDIMTEEKDMMIENDLSPKDINKYLGPRIKQMFFKTL